MVRRSAPASRRWEAQLCLRLWGERRLVMPALWFENEPLVVKAAQYVGLPILASNIGTLATSIRDGVNGWLLPPGDIEAWGRAFASFAPKQLAPDSSIKSMDENARELLEIYQEIHSTR